MKQYIDRATAQHARNLELGYLYGQEALYCLLTEEWGGYVRAINCRLRPTASGLQGPVSLVEDKAVDALTVLLALGTELQCIDDGPPPPLTESWASFIAEGNRRLGRSDMEAVVLIVQALLLRVLLAQADRIVFVNGSSTSVGETGSDPMRGVGHKQHDQQQFATEEEDPSK